MIRSATWFTPQPTSQPATLKRSPAPMTLSPIATAAAVVRKVTAGRAGSTTKVVGAGATAVAHGSAFQMPPASRASRPASQAAVGTGN